MAVTYNSSIIRDNLIFCMDAADTNGGSSAKNIVGSSTTALVNEASFDSANYGSISLDGTDDHITTTLSNSVFSSTDTKFTIDIWLKADINNSALGIYGFTDGGAEYIEIRMDGTKYMFSTRYNSITRSATGTAITNTWTNLTCVKAPGLQDVYLNGEIETVGSPNTAQGDDLSFGSMSPVFGARGTSASPSASYWNGNISVVRVYDRALSSVEIRTNYDATKRRYL
mgnify:FL=1